MRNDPPTSLSRRFGYKQWRAAGMGGIPADRSPKQINKIVEDRKFDQWMIDNVVGDSANDPQLQQFVTHRLKEGCTLNQIWHELLMTNAYLRSRERGHSLARRLRHWAPPSN